MLSNVEVRNQIISLSRQWLSAEMVGVEYTEAVNTLMSGLTNGIYTYRVVNGDKVSEAHKLSVVK